MTENLSTRPAGPIGLLGGTFDPIHYGHLRLAEEASEALGLARMLIMPAGIPPHRMTPQASVADRGEMAKRAISNNPRLELVDLELRKDTAAYMVESLQALRADIGPECPLILFLGADAFAHLTSWHQWRQLFELAHIGVCHRPGFSLPGWEHAFPEALRQLWQERHRLDPETLRCSAHGLIHTLAITQLDISASAIRQLIAAGRSPRYLLPDCVIDYICTHKLYT